ncbi:MAG: efflux RND transporter permease subunit [Oligoflexales bacterium]
MSLLKPILNNSLVINLLTVLIIGVGIYCSFNIRREAYPPVDLDIVDIFTNYPGASPRQVEAYVTNNIEDQLKGLSGIKKMSSSSVESQSRITLELDPDLGQRERDQLIDDIRREAQNIQDLPDEVEDLPYVLVSDSSEIFILEISVSAEVSYRKIQELAKDLSERINDLEDSKKTILRGYRDEEIWVEINPEATRKNHLSIGEIINAIKNKNINLPAGSLEVDSNHFLVRTVGEASSIEELKNIPLRASPSQIIRLKDIATVKRSLKKGSLKFRTNGKSSVNILVQKKLKGDIVDLVEDIKDITDNFLSKTKVPGLEVNFTNDLSSMVNSRLGILFNNGGFGFLLVLLFLLLFLAKGIAFVTAIGMPIAFFSTIIVMYFQGMTINLITMFGLVMVIGMVVDDSIIVAENIWQHYEKGESPWAATVKGTKEVFFPVTVTILTTIAAFSPLMNMSGLIGKFIYALPLVIIITLLMSLLESMIILPSHAFDVLRFIHKKEHNLNQDNSGNKRKNKEPLIKTLYTKLLSAMLNFRYVFVASIICLLIFCLYLAKFHMDIILFPTDDAKSVIIQAELPYDTSLDKTSESFKAIEKVVESLPKENYEHYITSIGLIQDNPNDLLSKFGPFMGQVLLTLTDKSKQNISADAIIELLRPKIETLKKVEGFTHVSFDKINLGPPVGKPIAISLSGEDLEQLQAASNNVKQLLEKTTGVTDVRSSLVSGKDELRIKPKEDELAKSFLDNQQLSYHVRAIVDGIIPSKIDLNGERRSLRVKFNDKNQDLLKSLKSSYLTNKLGKSVAFNKVAKVTQLPGLNYIGHKDGLRTATISANLHGGATSLEINQSLVPKLDDLEKKFPHTEILAGGEYEDTNESVENLQSSFMVALLIIYFILVTQFKTLSQPFVIMAAIPFGIIGVILAFYVHQLPLSFLGMIGMIGLSGVVINDSIVLVDFINNARKRGMSSKEACIYAGGRRFRAVWMTTITTVVGLLPLVYGIGGRDLFLEPAALAMSYGLIFGTVLILFFVPCLYMIRDDLLSLIPWKHQSLNKHSSIQSTSISPSTAKAIDQLKKDLDNPTKDENT